MLKDNIIDEMVAQFIDISRKHIPSTSVAEDSENERIKNLFANIIPNNTFWLELRLLICNTFNKYSVLLPIKSGENNIYYLVFDKYLLEINRIFNALYLSSDNAYQDIWKLCYKLLGEEYFIIDDELISLYLTLNHRALGEFSITDDLKSLKNEFWIHIQEIYILVHELAHFSYTTASLAEDIDMHEEINTELKNMLYKLKTYSRESNFSQLVEESISILGSKDISIIEECYCDGVAYLYVLEHIKAKYNKDNTIKFESLKALFICLLNMQLLTIFGTELNVEPDIKLTNSIRYLFFRIFIKNQLSENEEQHISKIFDDMATQYEERISREMLYCLATLEHRISNLQEPETRK